MSMAKAMGPFRDSQAPSLLSGPQTDVPAKTLSNRPCMKAIWVIIKPETLTYNIHIVLKC